MKQGKILVIELQKLFANMLLSNLRYQDPTGVLKSIVDDDGHKLAIHEQQDIGEFLMNFLDRL